MRAIGFVIAFVLCLPLILVPLTTSVPTWAWLLLAAGDVASLVALLRLAPAGRGVGVGLAGTLLVSVLAVAASQYFAATPEIRGEDGKPIPGSIASLEKVALNGTEQWIAIRGHDVNKPVLLHLGMGGPGGGGFAVRPLFEPLEKDFVVVYWDEPGTGKSYHALPIAELTPQRFIDDAHALTLYLRERFQQDKIYVYGVSWTSILGIWLVQEYPDLYAAYIGSGQMINTTENDVMGYEFALKHLAETGDSKRLETLRRNGPPPYRDDDRVGKYVAYLDVLNEYMGLPGFSVIVPIIPFTVPEYGLVDKVNHTLGLAESFKVVYPQLEKLDFRTQAAKLDVPVYMFVGRNDVNAMTSLVEEYYNVLEAPHKELIWLDGGHGLGGDNFNQFREVVVDQILVETQAVK